MIFMITLATTNIPLEQVEYDKYTVNLVKLATEKTQDLLLQVTSIKGFSHFVATSAPLPVASFTKLTVPDPFSACQ